MPFLFQRLEIPDVVLIEPGRFADERGWFMETFKRSDFAANGISCAFVQDNMSYSMHGVVRGLHYQVPPAAQAKLVTVLRGEVFDVALDIRPDSSSYRRWVGVRLTADGGEALFIPAGFAHGFAVISADALVAYKCDAQYNANAERGVFWNDPAVAVTWPITDAIVSQRDLCLPLLADIPREPVL